jgi:hypothetical protein
VFDIDQAIEIGGVFDLPLTDCLALAASARDEDHAFEIAVRFARGGPLTVDARLAEAA